jgi:SNF2 family DNA or RNA helicase
LGKTSTCLAAFKVLKEKGLVKKALMIAPLRPMRKTWPDEIKKWADFADITYTIVHGGNKEAALAQDVDIYLINPEGIKWLYDPKRRRPEFDVLIVDESTKFKDSSTQRFKALKPHLPSFSRRWILTGTPVPNGLLDLFGQIYVLDLGRSLGRFITHYRTEYFVPSGYGGYVWKPQADAFTRIIDTISPLILQMSAEEYLQMPELVFQSLTVSLPPSSRKLYDELEKDFLAQMESGEEIIALNAAAAGTKLRQVANGALYTDKQSWKVLHDEKLDALESLLEELNGHSVLIFYEFKHDAERISTRLGGIPNLSGSTGKVFDDLVDRFNRGNISVLLAHPASAGHGLNLQGNCYHVVWFGIPWNLEYYDQAIARVYRQGQSADHVFVYQIVANATKDEDVVKVLNLKDRNQQGLLSALKQARNIAELNDAS